MELKETQASLTRQFMELVARHSPGLVRGSNPYTSSGGTRFYVWLWTKRRWFQRQSCKLMIGPDEPFENGNWEDLEIRVFDRAYLEGVVQLAAEYEKTTGKKITVRKEC